MLDADREKIREKSTILFDAGNTLVTIDFEAVAEILLRWGIMADPKRLRELEYQARGLIDLPEVIEDTLDTSRWIRHYTVILEGVGVKEEARQWEILRALKAEHDRKNLWRSVDPATPSLLAELKERGYRLGLISNADGKIESLMEQVGLRPYLEICVDSAVEGIEKPDPRLFAIALERLAVRPEECVYVGDLYHVDVTGARRAGVLPVLLDPGERHAGCDALRIQRLPELIELFH